MGRSAPIQRRRRRCLPTDHRPGKEVYEVTLATDRSIPCGDADGVSEWCGAASECVATCDQPDYRPHRRRLETEAFPSKKGAACPDHRGRETLWTGQGVLSPSTQNRRIRRRACKRANVAIVSVCQPFAEPQYHSPCYCRTLPSYADGDVRTLHKAHLGYPSGGPNAKGRCSNFDHADRGSKPHLHKAGDGPDDLRSSRRTFLM